ncbi:MAG: helix-turn-helix domain-containing protein [Muribaculaceae bacterium]|nr:helix-turn-helix domain-containing protein [Muribaculaceae bacterium]
MRHVMTEITPLSEKDCFYLVDRIKIGFDYPLHQHDEFELNFVTNCEGARRIVGDSVEETGMFDLVLVGSNLEHTWEQHKCLSNNMREITIQFSPSLLSDNLLDKNQLVSFKSLFENAKAGIAFDTPCILKVYSRLDEITKIQQGFYRVLKLLEILFELSIDKNYRLLNPNRDSNSSSVGTSSNSRIQKIEDYIKQNYKDHLTLESLASIAGMSPTSFSRFFKEKTGRTVSDYIIDIRLGHATRKLANDKDPITEVCFDCGFNNISNFNRLFKRKKGCTPHEFRDNYRKNKIIV